MHKKQKAKSQNIALKPKNKKQRKMWSSLLILLVIILVLILISWILQWSGVVTTITVDQYFIYDQGSWQQIASLPKGTDKFVTVTNQWWQDNQATLDQSNVYLVQGFSQTNTRIQGLGILDLFVAPVMGFLDKGGIIIFILVVGAFTYMVIASKAMDAAGQSVIAKFRGKEIWAIIPLMFFCSLGGTTFNFAEETFGFFIILVPLMMMAGFDSMTGLLIVLVGAAVGVMTSTVNPFIINIAVDSINGALPAGTDHLTIGDGLVWRIVSWLVVTSIATGFVMWYANRVKKNPSKSVTFKTRKGDEEYFLVNKGEKIEMTGRRKATLIVFAIVFIFMIVYLISWDKMFNVTVMADMADWIHLNIPYFNFTFPGFGEGGLEFVVAFFIIGVIVVGLINTIKTKKPAGETTETLVIKDFTDGVKDIVSVTFIIATASGIGYVLVQTHMQELFVNALTGSIGNIDSGIGQIMILFLIFVPLTFLIPSGTGFATAVFPLLTGIVAGPNGTLDPVVASGSVTAFSFGFGLIQLVTPTNAVLVVSLELSRVNYGTYIKFMAPFIAVLGVILMGLLAIGGAIGGNIA